MINGLYYSKSDILKMVKDYIKKNNLADYLTLGKDDILHIKKEFKQKVEKLIQENPDGCVKLIIEQLGYANIVKGIAENLSDGIFSSETYDVKKYMKTDVDGYSENCGNFFTAVEEYYKEEDPTYSIEKNDKEGTFKALNNLNNFNYDMYCLYDDSIINRQKYNVSDIFIKDLYSETRKFSDDCSKVFLHKKTEGKGFVEYNHSKNYFDQWNLKDEIDKLSHSKKLFDDVLKYIEKNYDKMQTEYYDSLDIDDEKTI